MSIYKDPLQPVQVRIDAAKAAIGYERPRLAATEHTANAKQPVVFEIVTGIPSRRHRDDDAGDGFNAPAPAKLKQRF
jgi:hypothetical protein